MRKRNEETYLLLSQRQKVAQGNALLQTRTAEETLRLVDVFYL
ncbi:MAG: hypothetical protein ACLTSK_01915 [Christensenellales bacterium]